MRPRRGQRISVRTDAVGIPNSGVPRCRRMRRMGCIDARRMDVVCRWRNRSARGRMRSLPGQMGVVDTVARFAAIRTARGCGRTMFVPNHLLAGRQLSRPIIRTGSPRARILGMCLDKCLVQCAHDSLPSRAGARLACRCCIGGPRHRPRIHVSESEAARCVAAGERCSAASRSPPRRWSSVR